MDSSPSYLKAIVRLCRRKQDSITKFLESVFCTTTDKLHLHKYCSYDFGINFPPFFKPAFVTPENSFKKMEIYYYYAATEPFFHS